MSTSPVVERSPTENAPPPSWSRIGRWIGGGLLVVPVLLLVVGMLLPGRYQVERTLVVAAPPADVHSIVEDLRTWPEWTAWSPDRHPGLEYRFSDPPRGVEAKQTWTADEGNGTLTITESDPRTGLAYVARFDGHEPMLGRLAFEELTDPAGRTRITWTTAGELGRNPIARWFGLGIDAAIGSDLEIGLDGLRRRVESE